MKENYICNALYRIFDNEVPLDEIYSFIYFLKGCGAYEKYANNLDVNYIKYSIAYNINKSNKQYSYYNLISISFIWKDTYEGRHYWSVINNLHQIIVYYKVDKNKLNFNDIAHDTRTLQFPNIYYNDMFGDIVSMFKSYNIKDEHLKHFIECLYDYIMKNI